MPTSIGRFGSLIIKLCSAARKPALEVLSSRYLRCSGGAYRPMSLAIAR